MEPLAEVMICDRAAEVTGTFDVAEGAEMGWSAKSGHGAMDAETSSA